VPASAHPSVAQLSCNKKVPRHDEIVREEQEQQEQQVTKYSQASEEGAPPELHLSEKARGKQLMRQPQRDEVMTAKAPASSLPDVDSHHQEITVRLLRSSPEESFGLVLNPQGRVVLVDDAGPAVLAGLLPLDKLLAVNGVACHSAAELPSMVAGRTTVDMTMNRPADEWLSSIAAAEDMAEWVEWERAVLASAMGDVDALFSSLHELSMVTGGRLTEYEVALSRRVSEQEAAAFRASYGIATQPGDRLDDIAIAFEQQTIASILHDLLESYIEEGEEEGEEEERGVGGEEEEEGGEDTRRASDPEAANTVRGASIAPPIGTGPARGTQAGRLKEAPQPRDAAVPESEERFDFETSAREAARKASEREAAAHEAARRAALEAGELEKIAEREAARKAARKAAAAAAADWAKSAEEAANLCGAEDPLRLRRGGAIGAAARASARSEGRRKKNARMGAAEVEVHRGEDHAVSVGGLGPAPGDGEPEDVAVVHPDHPQSGDPSGRRWGSGSATSNLSSSSC
jgi:hypothetical protein